MSNPRGSLFLISSTFAAFVSRCSVSIFDATAVKLEAGESRMPTEMLHRATACIRSVNRSCLCIKYRAEGGNETLRGFFSVFTECLGFASHFSCITTDSFRPYRVWPSTFTLSTSQVTPADVPGSGKLWNDCAIIL